MNVAIPRRPITRVLGFSARPVKGSRTPLQAAVTRQVRSNRSIKLEEPRNIAKIPNIAVRARHARRARSRNCLLIAVLFLLGVSENSTMTVL